MEALLSIAKIAGERLMVCKEVYGELTAVVASLQNTLENVQKLASDRAKETRLAGTIQENLTRQLNELIEVVDAIIAERQTVSGKIVQFLGTCCGKGAKAHLGNLNAINRKLQDTLKTADSEALVVVASAAEEMAGGAAARHIGHEGARRFWREQFKNELAMPASKFLAGLRTVLEPYRLVIGPYLTDIENVVSGRVDPSLDGTVSVSEFAAFFKSRDSSLSVAELILSQLSTGNLKDTMVAGHGEPIQAVTVHHNFVATGDRGAILKVWQLSSGFTRIATASLGRPDDTIGYLHFVPMGDKITLLAAVGTNFVLYDVFAKCWLACLPGAHRTLITSIAVEGLHFFSTEQASMTCTVWKILAGGGHHAKDDAGGDEQTDDFADAARHRDRGGASLGGSIITMERLGTLPCDDQVLRYIVPIGDERHCATLIPDSFVAIYDYILLCEVARIVPPSGYGYVLQPGPMQSSSYGMSMHNTRTSTSGAPRDEEQQRFVPSMS